MKILLLISMICMINGYPSSDNLDDQCLNYCSNDGICVIIKNQPQCYCFPGWTGKFCKDPRERRTIRIDPSQRSQMSAARTPACSMVPADFCNRGLCQFDGQNFTCACPPELSGAYCELPSPCINYCANNGRCTVTKDETANCTCQSGFDGTRCQNIVTLATNATNATTTTIPPTTPTTTNALCVAFQPRCGPGTCVVNNGILGCQCPPTHTGTYCQTETGVTAGPATPGPATPGPATPGPATPGPGTPGPGTPGPGTPGPGTPGPGTVNPGGNSDDACSSNPCQNNRPCYNNGNTFYCFCGSAFSGPTCATASG